SFESAELRHSGDGLSSSQKLMILVLSMTLYGVGDIVASVLPEISVGPLELGVSYFSFIAVVLAALLNPVWVALGAPLAELAFAVVRFWLRPAIWLAPRLYVKSDPVRGLRPRDPADPPRRRGPGGIGFWLVAVFAVVAAAAIALLAAWEEFVGKQGLSTIGSF